MARNELRFGILGPLEISAGFRSLPLGTPKQRAVLATLIIHRNRPVGIDSLIDAAWEQDRPEGSRATVYTYVSNLRRLVSTTGADSHSILASAPPGYRLAVADNQYDVARFISQRSAGLRAAAAGSFEQASDHLSAALAEWRGPVLDDLREFSFVTRLANSLVEDKIIAHTALAEAEIACGRADSVISELEELILEHPYHEALWRQLIAAYYVSERQSDALDAYRRLKTSLAEDLGVDPGPKVRTLYEQVLRQQALDTRSPRSSVRQYSPASKSAADTWPSSRARSSSVKVCLVAWSLTSSMPKKYPSPRMSPTMGRSYSFSRVATSSTS